MEDFAHLQIDWSKRHFHALNFEKVEGAYCFGLVRPSVGASVRYKFKIGF